MISEIKVAEKLTGFVYRPTLELSFGILLLIVGIGLLLTQLIMNFPPTSKGWTDWAIAALIAAFCFFLGYHLTFQKLEIKIEDGKIRCKQNLESTMNTDILLEKVPEILIEDLTDPVSEDIKQAIYFKFKGEENKEFFYYSINKKEIETIKNLLEKVFETFEKK